MILWTLIACSWHAAAPEPPVERIDAFAIAARGQTMMGQALVVSDANQTSLHALTPAGTSLFSVEVVDGEATVKSPDAELSGWLERLPFARDLSVLYRYDCLDRCRADQWKLVRKEDGLRVTGPGGPAWLTVDGAGRSVLKDSRRGYTLTVVKQAE
ncbi:MAG: DUF3261 domain-containing protein [Proteobacteria bacterium]|nr:DUF3261 domain-containing protein [Pseudomonadota bacterium]